MVAAGTFGLLAPISTAMAQGGVSDYPNRAVKIILGFPPGQASDATVRVFAAELNKAFGQPFVVENRPGAGATLAARDVSRSAADGYTLLFTSSGPLTVAPHLYANLGFDAMKDLEPIALVGHTPLILVVRSDSPIKSVGELVAASARRELPFGSGGNGVTNHLALELFKLASGAKLVHVPYKGAAPALNDLVGGQIDGMFETPLSAMPFVRSGRLRALAVTSPTRNGNLPDIPTVAEFYSGFEVMLWGTFAVPSGTPKPIGEKLALVIAKAQEDPKVKEFMIQSGGTPTPDTTPAKATAYARAEFDKWGSVIRRANVKLN